MSLKAILARTVALVLIGCLAVGAALTYWTAQARVSLELRAALVLGENTARRAVADVARVADPAAELQAVVRAFDGNRHIRAEVLGRDGEVLNASSILPPENNIPEWFFQLLAEPPQTVAIALPAELGPAQTLLLATDARGEIDEVWGESVIDIAIIGVFCTFILAIVTWTLGHALRPLGPLLLGFERIGRGDYSPRVAVTGPSELTRLCQGFNAMAERLAEMEAINQRLYQQLAQVQEEERADLARDLHDEVSPLLFSVDVDVSAIRGMTSGGQHRAIAERTDAIQDALQSIKRHVRSILSRLRPAAVSDQGLKTMVESLVAFWETRRPDTAFSVAVPDDSWGERVDATLFAIIRESVSNALKHTSARCIDIAVAADHRASVVKVSIRDDGGGLRSKIGGLGFGMLGMKERVAAVGGTITVANRPDGLGVVVDAVLPVRQSADAEPSVECEVRAA